MQDIQNTRKEAPFLGLTGMGGGAASLGLVGQAVVVGQQTYAT